MVIKHEILNKFRGLAIWFLITYPTVDLRHVFTLMILVEQMIHVCIYLLVYVWQFKVRKAATCKQRHVSVREKTTWDFKGQIITINNNSNVYGIIFMENNKILLQLII